MELYSHLIENPLFFKWIYHPTIEIESYWNQYLKSNPEEADLILEFKSRFQEHLSYNDKSLAEIEKRDLARRIIGQLEGIEARKKRFLVVRTLMRYAAVAFISIILGGSLVYLYFSDRDAAFPVESLTLSHHISEPVLILGNEKEIRLKREQSELEYSTDGTVRIDENEIVDESGSQEVPSMNTLVIPYGSRSTVTLADGTKVWLNAGSRLVYPSRFNDKTREVYLVGEALFDVEPDKKHPFIVKTTNLSVRVLGTRFNLSAYPEDQFIQTVLAEGSVELTKAKAGLFDRSVLLEPGQMGVWSKENNETNIYQVDVESYTLWAEGLFRFSDADLSRVIKKLERFYNIRFKYENPMDGSMVISGKLDVSKDKQEVFEYLEKLTGLQFEKLNDWNYVVK
ncbi:FecR family protein [Mangrovibacterium sp.]|uniref:FecR family protein n=1 Tax=Mangrovibacterium sp. TaxID=1961364 RepID=UPI00356A3A65